MLPWQAIVMLNTKCFALCWLELVGRAVRARIGIGRIRKFAWRAQLALTIGMGAAVTKRARAGGALSLCLTRALSFFVLVCFALASIAVRGICRVRERACAARGARSITRGAGLLQLALTRIALLPHKAFNSTFSILVLTRYAGCARGGAQQRELPGVTLSARGGARIC